MMEVATYDKFSTSGFRNYMEGFDVLTDDQAGRQDCAGDELCQCETRGSGCSCETGSDCEGSQASQLIASCRLLHNSVSRSNIYIE